MNTPTVSFVVPCYKLAHLLSECVNSILTQTYGDLEVLIMDDCSPDNTAEVVRSFTDPRVKHVRNDPNLGHLRNYNKGIGMSRGKYIWLISADDYLKQPYILQRYVELLDRDPRVGYTFCPGAPVNDKVETDLTRWLSHGRAVHGNHDKIISGRVLLQKLLLGNTIVAASGLVRRDCYEKVSLFPLTMPWAGDWYLWCVFALHFDVGYFAEPMVCYREHELAMTNILMEKNVEDCVAEDASVVWAVKTKADEARDREVSNQCEHALAHIYSRSMKSKWYRACKSCMTIEQFEDSLGRNAAAEIVKNRIRALVYVKMADHYYGLKETGMARTLYARSLQIQPWMAAARAKSLLLSIGKPGEYLWKGIQLLRGRTAGW